MFDQTLQEVDTHSSITSSRKFSRLVRTGSATSPHSDAGLYSVSACERLCVAFHMRMGNELPTPGGTAKQRLGFGISASENGFVERMGGVIRRQARLP